MTHPSVSATRSLAWERRTIRTLCRNTPGDRGRENNRFIGGDDRGDDDVIDAHMKIGDIYRDKDNQFSEARKEYQVGLATCLAALTKHPDSFNLLRDKGKAFFRIAELLRTEKTEGTLDEARAFYRQASEVQDALITRNAKEALASPKTLDLTLKSNLAATDTHWECWRRRRRA